jgi:5-methyltetrahydrofolate--homocysteine methyltransferase
LDKFGFINALGGPSGRILVLDGAMGTMLQESGLMPGACPESMNLEQPDIVTKIHLQYAVAGADILTTNTFGGSRIKLSEYGLGDKVAEVSHAAVKAARAAADSYRKGRGPGAAPVFIAGDMGPTGKFIEPVGELSFDDAYANFYEQAKALAEAGADLLLIETMSDLKEARCAVIAAKAASSEAGHRLPVAITMTFQQDLRTLLGTPPDVAVAVLEAAGADFVGANCSLGPEGIYEAAKIMAAAATVDLVFQPNAGLPKLVDGKTIYPASPEELGEWAGKFAGLGVRLIGSCCGSTPAHTKAIADAVRGKDAEARDKKGFGTRLTSRTRLVSVGTGFMPAVIGERINPTGRKALSEELSKGVFNIVKREAREQGQTGAALIDINVGLPGADEEALMASVVRAAEGATDLPLVIDSTDPRAIEAALKEVGGKCLVNSVTGDKDRLESILPLVKKYGAAVVGLTIDGSGIPQTAEERLRIAENILDACVAHGIPKEDLVIDCLVMTASAEQDQAVETLKAIALIKEKLGLTTSLGISNVSFGLPERPLINATYLAMALSHGLDAAMVNIYDQRIRDVMAAGAVLTGRDRRADSYVKAYKKKPVYFDATLPALRGSGKASSLSLEESIKKAVIDGDRDNIVAMVEAALDRGTEPMEVGNTCLIPALEEVGKLYESGEIFLPQVMQSAETMKAAFARLKLEMKGQAGNNGKVLLATVYGDVHDIGKNILATLLENHGLEVIDLGKNVPVESVLDEAEKHKPDVIGLSALMTTTMTQMGAVIKERDRRGLHIPVVLGGAVVTDSYAKSVGAAAFSRDAMEAVEIFKRIIKERK